MDSWFPLCFRRKSDLNLFDSIFKETPLGSDSSSSGCFFLKPVLNCYRYSCIPAWDFFPLSSDVLQIISAKNILLGCNEDATHSVLALILLKSLKWTRNRFSDYFLVFHSAPFFRDWTSQLILDIALINHYIFKSEDSRILFNVNLQYNLSFLINQSWRSSTVTPALQRTCCL